LSAPAAVVVENITLAVVEQEDFFILHLYQFQDLLEFILS
jgi:hypothetical protein